MLHSIRLSMSDEGGGIGSVTSTETNRKLLAEESKSHNRKCKEFRELFLDGDAILPTLVPNLPSAMPPPSPISSSSNSNNSRSGSVDGMDSFVAAKLVALIEANANQDEGAAMAGGAAASATASAAANITTGHDAAARAASVRVSGEGSGEAGAASDAAIDSSGGDMMIVGRLGVNQVVNGLYHRLPALHPHPGHNRPAFHKPATAGTRDHALAVWWCAGKWTIGLMTEIGAYLF
jgi:hypothetical protein